MIIKIFKIAILLTVLGSIFWIISYTKAVNRPLDKEGEMKKFVVSGGDSVKNIGANLEAEGLISSKTFFEIYIWRQDMEKNMQAGVYELSPAMSIKEIANDLSSGKVVSNEREIKVIEGWNNRDIARYFEEQGLFPKEEFVKEVKNKSKYAARFEFLKGIPDPYDMEGYLFPDTYKIFIDASVNNVINKMLSNFDRKITEEMRLDIEEQGKDLYEIVAMASLIEKEVRSQDDMKMVSGIFNNRIKNGQPLQSCATLAYILGENKPIYSLEDTKIDSPYNTYKHRGLPPGPITNPGLRAIEAAIYPADTDYNYFLTASESGETIFSKTLEEHNINKAKYLK